MIIVNFDETNKVFEMTGHANYADAGTDIVCAAASAMVITSFNGIAKFLDESEYEAVENDGYIKVTLSKSTKEVDLLLQNLQELLQELQIQFPKNIKIK